MIANDSSLTVVSPQECDIGDVGAAENKCEDFPTMDDNVCSLPAREREDHPVGAAQEFPIGVDGSLEVKEAEDSKEDGPELSSMLSAYQEHIDSLDDNSLNLSLFSCQEKVQVDILHTLSKLGTPMKAYKAVMQWTSNKSVPGGHVSRITPITS